MKKIKNSLIFISLITAASSIQAAPVFQGRMQFGVQNYDFELSNLRLNGDIAFNTDGVPANLISTRSRPATEAEFTGPLTFDLNHAVQNNESQTAADLLPTLGLGGTVIFENGIFIDGYYQTNVDGSQASLKSDTAPVTVGEERMRFSYFEISDIDIDRNDVAISIGKSLNSFTLSAGYKSGETDFNQTLKQYGEVGSNFSADGTVDVSLKLDGPFVGMAYSIPIRKSTLSFNVALADLDAGFSTSFAGSGFGEGPTLVKSDLSGSASGATYGVKLSGDLTDKWGYTLGADYYSYDFDVSATVVQNRFTDPQDRLRGTHTGDVSAKITEELFSLRLDLKYTF